MGKIADILIFYVLPVMFTHSGLTLSSAISHKEDFYIEVPTMKINFYMMGKEDLDESTLHNLQLNMDYLNEEFEGKIKFTNEYYLTDNQSAYLPDIYKALLDLNDDWVDDIVSPIELQGSLNVFIFETYREEKKNAALMGFTPLLPLNQEDYGLISPEFDRMYIAYDGLKKKSTLVHEVGHFLGLKHPWEMNELKKQILGFNSKADELNNHMSYHHTVNKFTPEQLEHMRTFALKYRSYLFDETEWVAYNN